MTTTDDSPQPRDPDSTILEIVDDVYPLYTAAGHPTADFKTRYAGTDVIECFHQDCRRAAITRSSMSMLAVLELVDDDGWVMEDGLYFCHQHRDNTHPRKQPSR